MPLEIYAVLDTNDCPKKLKSSGSDEFYYYFPPPLPSFILLFILTKDIEEINYLYRVHLCIDNDIDDKIIGEMGGDRPSICWNGDWSKDEKSRAKEVLSSGRALKLYVLKEDLPSPHEEDFETTEQDEEEELNEDELLKSSLAMLDDDLDERAKNVKRKKIVKQLCKENGKKDTKKGKASAKKTSQKESKTAKKNGNSKDEVNQTKTSKKSEKKSKSVSNKAEEVQEDTFEFVDETETNLAQGIVAGRIGGKRVSPFGVLPKLSKKSYHETKDEKLKNSIPFQTPVSFTDVLPTRNPSRRWGHAFCPLSPGRAILIGGEGIKNATSADSIWTLDICDNTWKAETTDQASVPRRVGHSICYDDKLDVLYLYGGTKHDKWFSDVYSLDLKEWKWTKLDTIGKAPTLSYHSCTMEYDELLIFGGVYPTPAPNPDGCSNELHIFSTESRSWYTPVVSGDVPLGRSGHSACMLDRKLHIFGGWNAPECFNDLHVLDLGIMNFTKINATGSIPSARTWHSSQLLSDLKRFCIYGGFDGDKALDDLHIYSSIDNSWTKVFYPGLVCRAGHGVIKKVDEADSSDDKLLVFGGGDNDGHFYNDLATLNLSIH